MFVNPLISSELPSPLRNSRTRPTESRPDRREAELPHSVASIYLTSLLQGAIGVCLPASSSVLRARLSIGDTLYGALFLPGLALAFTAALGGRMLLRRWSLKTLFLFGLASQATCMLLMGLCVLLPRPFGLAVLIAALAVSGPAGGIMGITLNTAAIEIFPRARSGALSALHGVLGLGAAIGPMIVALTTQLGFWSAAPFFLAAVLLSLIVLSGARRVHGLTEHRHEDRVAGAAPRRLIARSLTVLLYGAGEATFTAWAVVFLTENRRLPLAIAATALSAFWVAMTAGRLASIALVRWISPVRLSLVLALGMAASFCLVSRSAAGTDTIARFAIAGLCCSALFPLLLGLGSAEFPDRTPQVTASYSAAVMVGLAVGSFCVGPARGVIGLERIYLVSAVGPLCLVVLLIVLARRSSTRGVSRSHA